MERVAKQWTQDIPVKSMGSAFKTLCNGENEFLLGADSQIRSNFLGLVFFLGRLFRIQF